ncbi:MAG: hypothetical protein FJY95_12975 [Candidatus Handelsmanbacteria bacterium]|nr:hypothetical protein [Candidatus Handelsmanbacteria bacterium]
MVLPHLTANYLQLVPRLSPGQACHLERKAHQAAQPFIREEALNRRLDAYIQWQTPGGAEHRRIF